MSCVEKVGKHPIISVEGIMDLVVSPEEESKLDNPVFAPHIIPYYYPSHTFLSQVSNTAGEIILVSENYGIEANKDGATDTVF